MFYLLLIFIIFLSLTLVKKENFINIQDKCDRSIQLLAPLKNGTQDNRYRKTNALPWCKSWSNGKNEYKCFVNKHLQRKCMWIC